MLENLKKRYDKIDILSIENEAEKTKHESERNRKTFIEALYYLRHTKRFRENKVYQGATFDSYIRGRFMMSESKFEKERVAYICFPDATEKFGPGIVTKTVHELGSIKAGKVLNALPKNTRLEKIEKKVMEEKPPEEKKIIFRGPTKHELQQKIIKLEEAIREKDEIIAEQAEQIEKLKNTVKRYKIIFADAPLERTDEHGAFATVF